MISDNDRSKSERDALQDCNETCRYVWFEYCGTGKKEKMPEGHDYKTGKTEVSTGGKVDILTHRDARQEEKRKTS